MVDPCDSDITPRNCQLMYKVLKDLGEKEFKLQG